MNKKYPADWGGKKSLSWKIRRIYIFLILRLQMNSLWKSTFRRKLLRASGIKIGKSHVGQDVIFDNIHPECIEIGDDCAITYRCVIISHFVSTERGGIHIVMGRSK